MRIEDWIIAETKDGVALNKPSGVLSIPDREGKEPSLKSLLKEKYGEIFVVHRIDRDTSGLILFAKNAEAHKHFSLQFEHRATKKIYLGLVLGTPPSSSGTIDAPIAEHHHKKGMMTVHRQGKEAVTDYEVLQELGPYTWMQFRIHTGRTHQIRVHMKDLGHPLVMDPLYGDGKPVLLSSIKKKFNLSKKEESERPILNRLALHASTLTIQDMAGNDWELEAPVPKDLRATLTQLEKWK